MKRLKWGRCGADQVRVDLHALLRHAVDGGASDVHLKIGQPPALRHAGALFAAEGWPPLTTQELEEVLATVTADDPARRTRFDQHGDLDLAYTPPGLPRLRVNGFRQRGAISFAFRVIPTSVPTFASSGCPPGVALLADQPRGLVLVHGRDRLGQVDDARVDRRPHQPHAAASHIVTIEDPIEFLHDDQDCIVNQREVGLDTASSARRSAARSARTRT